MLKKILASFSEPKITPIVLTRKSTILVVVLRDSAMRSDRVRPVYGRLA